MNASEVDKQQSHDQIVDLKLIAFSLVYQPRDQIILEIRRDGQKENGKLEEYSISQASHPNTLPPYS